MTQLDPVLTDKWACPQSSTSMSSSHGSLLVKIPIIWLYDVHVHLIIINDAINDLGICLPPSQMIALWKAIKIKSPPTT